MAHIVIMINDGETPVTVHKDESTLPRKRLRVPAPAGSSHPAAPGLGRHAPAGPGRSAPGKPYDAKLVLENLKTIRENIVSCDAGSAVERCNIMIDHLENVLAES